MTLSSKAILLSAAPALAALVLGFGGSATGCSNLADITPLPEAGPDAYSVLPDFDGNYPPAPDAGQPPPPPGDDTSDAGVPPAHVRLAHLLQGGPAVDLCVRFDDADVPTWEKGRITANPDGPAPGGLSYGNVSARVAIDVPADGGMFSFALVAPGAECAGAEAGAPILSFAPVALAPEANFTLIAFGSVAAKGALGPKAISYADLPASATPTGASVRAFHGVPDLPPIDVVVGGATAAAGVKYGTAIGYPYASKTGYGTVAGGAPDGTTLTLKEGTNALKFKLPEIKAGAVSTIFLSGNATAGKEPALAVLVCIDNAPGAAPACTSASKL